MSNVRLPKFPANEESQSMSAMTDVVFLLLIFFIVTMSAYVETTLLETSLPTASKGNAAPDLSKVIRVDIPPLKEGKCLYVVNGMPLAPERLETLLSRYKRFMPDAEFLINCSPESEHHQLVNFLADCYRNNLKNLKLLKSQ